MAAVAGPPVSLTDVRNVFGAPAGTPLHNFYRGGPWVPNISQNAGVPTAPPIQLAQLAGATNYQPMTVTSHDVTADTDSGQTNSFIGTASATVTGGNPSKTYNWVHIDGISFVLATPTAQASAINHAGRPPAGTYTAHYRCDVSDGTATVSSNVITITENRV